MSQFELTEKHVGAALFATVALGLGAASIVSCAKDPVESTVCEAIDTEGKNQQVTKYPVGENIARVRFAKRRVLPVIAEETKGSIAYRDDRYILTVTDPIPEKLTSDNTDFSGTQARLILIVPELGQVGLTEPCIASNQVVSLPIQR